MPVMMQRREPKTGAESSRVVQVKPLRAGAEKRIDLTVLVMLLVRRIS
jgi:hypothetical protein